MTPPKTILTLADKVDAVVETVRELLLAEAKVASIVRLSGKVNVEVAFNEGGMCHEDVGITGRVRRVK